jgi:AraC-like DNA-binding protein/mannose-6-phosphate isomerase-like protein (cupin superfamily)
VKGTPTGVPLYSSSTKYDPVSVTKNTQGTGDYDYNCETQAFELNQGKGKYNVIFAMNYNGSYYMMNNYEATGYLNSDFKIFHLIDNNPKEFSYHYHDFYKILIFIRGNVSYFIEGKSYQLKPYDIILVAAGEIHKPIIHDDTPYERIIIYVSSAFFEDYRKDNYDLKLCFTKANEHHTNVLRMGDLKRTGLYDACCRLEQSFYTDEYANTLYQKILFLEFMIILDRVVINKNIDFLDTSTANQKVLEIMKYINEHLSDEISIDSLADYFYLNRSYLMHLFKTETGYTIGKYITEKRLFMAKNLIQNGVSVTNACYSSGFKNYATFFRAYKDKFNTSPKNAADFL